MEKKYIHKIDAVRGIAILLVLGYHTLLIFYPHYQVQEYSENGFLQINNLKSLLLNFNPIGQGWIGVPLFLIISGFLIHFIYLQNQRQFKLGNFFSKRVWRIYPPYFIVLCFFFIYQADLSKSGFSNFFSHLLLIHNLRNETFFGINGSFWSIALECQLYLLYPVYLFLIKHFKIYKTTIILLLLLLIWAVIGFYMGIYSYRYGGFVLGYWFVWGLGAFLADRYYSGTRIFDKPFFWLVFFYILFFTFKLFYLSNYFILIPASFMCIALIETFLYSHFFDKYLVNRVLIKFLSYTGLVSYSLYLIHQPFLEGLLGFYNPMTNIRYINTFISVACTYATLFTVSYSLYKLLELPSVELGKVFRKANRPTGIRRFYKV